MAQSEGDTDRLRMGWAARLLAAVAWLLAALLLIRPLALYLARMILPEP